MHTQNTIEAKLMGNPEINRFIAIARTQFNCDMMSTEVTNHPGQFRGWNRTHNDVQILYLKGNLIK